MIIKFKIYLYVILKIIYAIVEGINAQQCSDTDYVRAVYEASDLVWARYFDSDHDDRDDDDHDRDDDDHDRDDDDRDRDCDRDRYE